MAGIVRFLASVAVVVASITLSYPTVVVTHTLSPLTIYAAQPVPTVVITFTNSPGIITDGGREYGRA